MTENTINVSVENENDFSTNQQTIKRDYAPYRHVCYKICKDCGKMFITPDDDIAYYVNRFGKIPLRCLDCRARRREENDRKNNNQDVTE